MDGRCARGAAGAEAPCPSELTRGRATNVRPRRGIVRIEPVELVRRSEAALTALRSLAARDGACRRGATRVAARLAGATTETPPGRDDARDTDCTAGVVAAGAAGDAAVSPFTGSGGDVGAGAAAGALAGAGGAGAAAGAGAGAAGGAATGAGAVGAGAGAAAGTGAGGGAAAARAGR